MTKQQKINTLTEIILEANKAASRETSGYHTRDLLAEAILKYGLGRWTGDKIKTWLKGLRGMEELYHPLKIIWSQQTSTEKAKGSAEALNGKGFSGKYNETRKKWTGDAALAWRYLNLKPYSDGNDKERLRRLLIKYREQLAFLANVSEFNKKRGVK